MPAADHLIKLIKADKDDWIARVVAMRDEVAHAKGLRGYTFEPVPLPGGKFDVRKPRFMETETLPFMRMIYSNNIEFHQEFMCLTLGLRVSGLVLVPENLGSMGQRYGKYGRYVRWAWAFRATEDLAQQPSQDSLP